MWSGPTSCSQPPSRSTPLTVSRLEPIPWMSAPIFTSMRARSCTCGSQAALWTTVAPGVSAAAMQRVLGRHHRRLVHEDVAGPQPAVGRRDGDVAAVLVRWRRARGRRRGADPAGGGRSRRRRAAASARVPKRASSGPADEERRADAIRPARGPPPSRSTPAAHSATSLAPRHSTRTPRSRSSSSIASTSRMRGTLRSTTSSSVRTQAARIGSAAFLFPAGRTVPDSGAPPSMTNFSMRGRRFGGADGAAPRRLARVTAMPLPHFARGLLDPALRMDGVGLAAAAHARRRGGHARVRAAFRRGRGALGHHRAAPRPRLRALPVARGRPPSLRPARAGGARLSGRGRARRRLARGLPRVPRETPHGEDALRRRRAVRLPARRAPTCAPRASAA